MNQKEYELLKKRRSQIEREIEGKPRDKVKKELAELKGIQAQLAADLPTLDQVYTAIGSNVEGLNYLDDD